MRVQRRETTLQEQLVLSFISFSLFFQFFFSKSSCIIVEHKYLQCCSEDFVQEKVSPPHKIIPYGVALVSRIDKIIGLFCKRAP